MRQRKAALELSVNSIVIMVIAFVVLGLILAFTRGIFGQGRLLTDQAFEGVKLDAEASSSDKIAIQQSLSVPKGKALKKKVDVYNTWGDGVKVAKLALILCKFKDEDGLTPVDGKNSPSIESGEQRIESSDRGDINVFIDSNKAVAGDYTCSVVAYEAYVEEGGTDAGEPTSTGDPRIFASESVFVTITQ